MPSKFILRNPSTTPCSPCSFLPTCSSASHPSSGASGWLDLPIRKIHHVRNYLFDLTWKPHLPRESVGPQAVSGLICDSRGGCTRTHAYGATARESTHARIACARAALVTARWPVEAA